MFDDFQTQSIPGFYRNSSSTSRRDEPPFILFCLAKIQLTFGMKILKLFCLGVVITSGMLSPLSTIAQDKPAAAEKKQAVVNLDVAQAEKLLNTAKEVVVLDVRTPKEFNAGHIHGATNVDFQADDFEQKLAKLDKNKSYLVHCAVGGRSAKARDKMKEMNFKSIFHLDGGIKAWEKAGKKVER
jgi:phage shock protein E